MSAPNRWGSDIGTGTPAQSIYEASTTQKHRIGTRLKIGERTFYYGEAVASCSPAEICSPDQSLLGSSLGLLEDGNCVALAAGTAFSDQPAITAALAVGDTWLAVTHADRLDNVTKNLLVDGYVVLTDSANADYQQIYKIKRNSAMSSDIVAIELYDPIVTATTDGTTGISLMMNPWKKMRPADSTVDEQPGGVPLVEIAASSFGWFQTWGPSMIQVDAGHEACGGLQLMLSTTAGQADASNGTLSVIGDGLVDCTTAGADAALVKLRLYP